MEYKLIMAVSGFPSLYDTNSPTYRDLNMRSDAWRQVAEIVAVPESECRRKWKTLRDQHRRERQREKERRESGIGLFNYRPWRYSSILSFLNPFIDARAAGTNGWALEPQPSHLHAVDVMGCSTTTEVRSDDDDNYGVAVTDATSSSSSFSEFVQRKRPSPANGDVVRLKDAKIEPSDQLTAPEFLRHDLQPLQLRHTPGGSPPHATGSRLNHHEIPEREILDHTDEEEEAELSVSHHRPNRAKGWSNDGLLEAFLRRTESRERNLERILELDQRDDVTLFLLSLAPAMRRLCPEKQSLLRTRIQQLLHEAQFGPAHFT
ncbi:MADF DNA bdg domain containing [Solea senegalensis]|uniref:MADF DNA bdg domain containing n=1 Tax=Solea senegalensis TaxID=28829 RepID=A0AAV6RUA8_SOLSE|nr:uncharacterized protein LOC122761139 [Solea senegalensis]XP_043905548.1 uncharacterized protein LOC122784366 [Solea senegalensis]KAG7462286.1 MADF DNA bdg domain containing [Solea senegalensis]KAG7509031.1 MADF DNA bdg domain containing [Solea senegalensis]